jgi:hypothetical protein
MDETPRANRNADQFRSDIVAEGLDWRTEPAALAAEARAREVKAAQETIDRAHRRFGM